MITSDKQPSQIAPSGQRPSGKKRRFATSMVIALALLTLSVIAGASIEQHFFEGLAAPVRPTSIPVVVAGPLVRPPLSVAQVDAIMHLAAHLKYKQIASLSVSHMTLDEELGQLFMVEYN